jgi:hypothetical protein
MVIQSELLDRNELKKLFGIDDWQTPFEPRVATAPPLLGQPSKSLAIVKNNRLYRFSSTWASKKFSEKIATAPPLSAKLDEKSKHIINQSGVSIFLREENAQLNLFVDVKEILNRSESALSALESPWLHDFVDSLSGLDHEVVGLVYRTQQLDFRARAKLREGKSFDSFVDQQKNAEPWCPDLGLEPDHLLFAGAFHLHAFRSSAASRVLPQILLQEFADRRSFQWLRADMLRVLCELIGDSWNDLTAARIALYRNPDSEKQGLFSIVGVVDSREPAVVRKELARISLLTSPSNEVESAQRSAEIGRLVLQLGGPDLDLARRAQTRLVLAGDSAVQALQHAASANREALRSRADFALRRIKKRSELDRNNFAVGDPNFWATLNPGLRFRENVESPEGLRVHEITITPDPSKSPAEVESAIDAMKYAFGPQWSTIKIVESHQHFVFLVGSNGSLLDRTIRNLDPNKHRLLNARGATEQSSLQAPVHLFGGFSRLRDLGGASDGVAGPKPEKFDFVWASINFEPEHLDLNVLLPACEIWGLLGFLF